MITSVMIVTSLECLSLIINRYKGQNDKTIFLPGQGKENKYLIMDFGTRYNETPFRDELLPSLSTELIVHALTMFIKRAN